MRFLIELWGSFLYGRGMMQYLRGGHRRTIALLVKAGKCDPKLLENVLYHAQLGRSYLALRHREKARESLSRMCDLLSRELQSSGSVDEKREIRAALAAYADELVIAGDDERAREVQRLIDRLTRGVP
jgi:tetratricopeptide (TPR) repeat protein